jgi:hypothetical protein
MKKIEYKVPELSVIELKYQKPLLDYSGDQPGRDDEYTPGE